MSQTRPHPSSLPLDPLEAWPRALRALPLALWLRRHRTRCQLRALHQQDPQRLFQDLGLEPDAVERELRKRFWQP